MLTHIYLPKSLPNKGSINSNAIIIVSCIYMINLQWFEKKAQRLKYGILSFTAAFVQSKKSETLISLLY
jgi:hypothetical protein